MGRFAAEAASHRAGLHALRAELLRAKEVLPEVEQELKSSAAGLHVAADAVDALAAAGASGAGDGEMPSLVQRLLEAASSLSSTQERQEALRDSLAAAAGHPAKVAGKDHVDSTDRRCKLRDSRSKSKPRAAFDFSAFTRARWEAERLKGASMLGADEKIKVYMNEMPKPVQDEKPCSQVKGRHIMVNTVEKARKIYVEILVSGIADRAGFIRGANLARFTSLAAERSDCPSREKGGDMGWLARGKADSKFNEVAFVTPKGSCSPIFKSANGFHMFYCEERKA
mmetsp:Transcript_109592/g.193716  ORF Transcript_109592/g.193716 Transcript_109592/m.193716 type:complete len:283 (+) Transcript_109592:53-901(+)